MRNMPMMANPSEYREALWTVLHDGESPKTTKGSSMAVSKSDSDMMAAMLEQAKALRGENSDLDS
jgi:hypothetical protein